MLEKLKEYKELIGLIVFFLGGFIWLQQKFAHKQELIEQVKSSKDALMSQIENSNRELTDRFKSVNARLDLVNCLIPIQISATESTLTIRFLKDQIERNNFVIYDLQSRAPSLSQSEKERLVGQQTQNEMNKDELNDSIKRAAELRQNRDKCSLRN
jgi:hypothetical protein